MRLSERTICRIDPQTLILNHLPSSLDRHASRGRWPEYIHPLAESVAEAQDQLRGKDGKSQSNPTTSSFNASLTKGGHSTICEARLESGFICLEVAIIETLAMA